MGNWSFQPQGRPSHIWTAELPFPHYLQSLLPVIPSSTTLTTKKNDLEEQFFSYSRRPLFQKHLVNRKVDRKSQKSSSTDNMAEILPSYQQQINLSFRQLTLTSILKTGNKGILQWYCLSFFLFLHISCEPHHQKTCITIFHLDKMYDCSVR